jgi:DNA-binding beta-propeller fold protein YncE
VRSRRPTSLIASIVTALSASAVLAVSASAAAPVLIGEFACEAGNACNGATTFVPQGAAVDQASGDVYVTDAEHGLIDRFHSDGSYDSQIVNASFEFGQLKSGIAVDGYGDLYVGGRNGNAYAYEPSGSLVWEKVDVVNRICGVGFDPSGKLWIADNQHDELVELDRASGEKTGATIGVETPYEAGPCKFVFLADGRVDAIEAGGSLSEYSGAGAFLRDLQPGTGGWATDVALDPATGSVFAPVFEASQGRSKLREWSSFGNPLSSVSIPEVSENLDASEGVAIDSARGRIYVADPEAHKVLAFGFAGPLTVNVSGAGEVQSDPAGISCQVDESCTAELAGTVTLTASPAPGHVFAGWLGCKKTGASTCAVDVNGETEVTAVFLKDGAVGPSGPQGETGSKGAKGDDGPQGPQGRPGRPAKVVCKVKGPRKPKVTCTVKEEATAFATRLRWRLIRGGHTVNQGTTRHGRIHLGVLPPGHYRLKVEGGKGATAIVVGY